MDASLRNNPGAGSVFSRLGLLLAAAIGLAVALLPPYALFLLPGAFAAPRPAALATVIAAALAAAALAAAFLVLGFEGGLRRLERSRQKELRFSLFRLFAATAIFAYALGLVLLAPSRAVAANLVLVASAALLYAWLHLLSLILAPRPLSLRPLLAILADSGFSSLLLYLGGPLTAFWYPVYLWLALWNGFRFGLKSLALATLANTAGFAAVAATTPFWRADPDLAIGLLAALVLVPALAAPFLRPARKAPPRAQPAEEADPAESLALPAPSAILARETQTLKATTSELLRLLAEEARRTGEAVLGVATGFGEGRREPRERERAHALEAHARALLSRLDDMRDLGLAAVDELTPENEVFDLYEVAHAALWMLAAEAAASGRRLSLRVDPRLPYRLVGWSGLFRQILLTLLTGALESAQTGNLRIEIGRAGRDSGRVRFRIAIRSNGTLVVRAATLPIIARLVARMDGHLSADGSSFELPFALAEEPEAEVDLGGRLVLIASDRREFAEELCDWLGAFNARTRTIGRSEAAFRKIAHAGAEEPILIVDGRSGMLPALSFAYRAAAGRTDKTAVLFVADAPHFDPLSSIAEDLLAAILPAPLAKRVLAAALHGVTAGRRMGASRGEGQPEREAVAVAKGNGAAEHSGLRLVSPSEPLAGGHSEPRFGGDGADGGVVVEERTVAALRALGEGSDFFASVLDAFRTDSAALFETLRRTAEASDLGGFRDALSALKGCAANLGGMRLVALSASLREISAAELRLEGKELVERIGAELTRLQRALGDTLVDSASGE